MDDKTIYPCPHLLEISPESKIKLSLFLDEDVLTQEIETWGGFIESLPSDDDKAALTKQLNDCYKYSLAINSQAQMHPFPSVSISLIRISD